VREREIEREKEVEREGERESKRKKLLILLCVWTRGKFMSRSKKKIKIFL